MNNPHYTLSEHGHKGVFNNVKENRDHGNPIEETPTGISEKIMGG